MHASPEPIRRRRDKISIPAIWVAVALSILVHIMVMWQWMPQLRRMAREPAEHAKGPPLIVQLAPRAAARPAPEPAPATTPPPRAAAERPARKPVQKPAPEPRPPVLALPRQSPQPAPPPAPPEARPRAAPPEGDLASYIEARRKARGDTPAPAPRPAEPGVEDERTRANRLAAANLGTDRTPTYDSQARRSGGIFQIQRLTFDHAEFVFFGWNPDIRRNTTQLIEVRLGTHPNIRIAVVRRMITLIREHEQGDFTWDSHRLGRIVSLSARPRDTVWLEDFLMREFF